MQKLYLQDIGFIDVGFALLYLALFTWLFWSIHSTRSRGFRWLRLGSLYAMLTFLVLDALANFVFLAPDANMYSNLIMGGEEELLGGEMRRFGAFAQLISLFVGKSPFAFTIICIGLYQLGLEFFARSFQSLKPAQGKTQLLFFWSMSLLPSALFYMTMPLRETFVFFSFSIFVYGLVQFYSNRRILILLVGLFLLWFFRPGMFLMAAMSAILVTLWMWRLVWWKRLLLGAGGLTVIMVVANTYFIKVFSVMKIAANRNEAVTRNDWLDQTYGFADWNNWWDLLIDLPGLSLQYLLSPFPIMDSNDSWNSVMGLADAFVVLLFIMALLFFLKPILKSMTLPLLTFAVVVLCMGLYEYHYMGAVRHRFVTTALLIGMVLFNLKIRFLRHEA